MGILELARRELEKLFVNRTPTYTYKLGIPANGAITGTLDHVDPDSTITYTATSTAEGDVSSIPTASSSRPMRIMTARPRSTSPSATKAAAFIFTDCPAWSISSRSD